MTTNIQGLSQNYADPAIAGRQRRVVERELADMHRGKVCRFYKSAGDVVNRIRKEEPGWASATLLDIACGSAYYSEVIEFLSPGWIDYTGMDYNSGMVALAHECYPGIQVRRGNILDIPAEDDAFDIVLSGATIGHVYDWPKTVEELVRVAKTWLILHRTPVWVDGSRTTERIIRRDYEVDVVVTRFGRRDVIDEAGSLGMELVEAYETNPSDGVEETYTYLFRKVKE